MGLHEAAGGGDGVAALVAEALVEGPEQAGAAGHQHDEDAAGLQGCGEGTHHAFGRVQILQQVETEHGVEAVFEAGEILRDFRIDALDHHVGCAQEAIAQGVQVEGIFFGGDVQDAAGHEAPGNIADAGADFEDGIADMGAEFAGEPAQVLRGAGEIVEHAAAVGSGIEVVDQPEFEDDAEGFEAVFPADFLAFFVGAAVVTDGHFVNAEFAFGALHDDFGLEAETVGADGDALEQVGAKDLVTGFHVGEVEVAEHVGNQGEALVDGGVPERQDAGLLAGHVARAEDGVGVAVEERLEQAGVLGGIVLEVGVLNERKIAGGLLDGGANGGALARVAFLAEEADLGEAGGQALEDLPGAVG